MGYMYHKLAYAVSIAVIICIVSYFTVVSAGQPISGYYSTENATMVANRVNNLGLKPEASLQFN